MSIVGVNIIIVLNLYAIVSNTMYSIQCTMYSIQCTLYIVYCTLYIYTKYTIINTEICLNVAIRNGNLISAEHLTYTLDYGNINNKIGFTFKLKLVMVVHIYIYWYGYIMLQ